MEDSRGQGIGVRFSLAGAAPDDGYTVVLPGSADARNAGDAFIALENDRHQLMLLRRVANAREALDRVGERSVLPSFPDAFLEGVKNGLEDVFDLLTAPPFKCDIQKIQIGLDLLSDERRSDGIKAAVGDMASHFDKRLLVLSLAAGIATGQTLLVPATFIVLKGSASGAANIVGVAFANLYQREIDRDLARTRFFNAQRVAHYFFDCPEMGLNCLLAPSARDRVSRSVNQATAHGLNDPRRQRFRESVASLAGMPLESLRHSDILRDVGANVPHGPIMDSNAYRGVFLDEVTSSVQVSSYSDLLTLGDPEANHLMLEEASRRWAQLAEQFAHHDRIGANQIVHTPAGSIHSLPGGQVGVGFTFEGGAQIYFRVFNPVYRYYRPGGEEPRNGDAMRGVHDRRGVEVGFLAEMPAWAEPLIAVVVAIGLVAGIGKSVTYSVLDYIGTVRHDVKNAHHDLYKLKAWMDGDLAGELKGIKDAYRSGTRIPNEYIDLLPERHQALVDNLKHSHRLSEELEDHWMRRFLSRQHRQAYRKASEADRELTEYSLKVAAARSAVLAFDQLGLQSDQPDDVLQLLSLTLLPSESGRLHPELEAILPFGQKSDAGIRRLRFFAKEALIGSAKNVKPDQLSAWHERIVKLRGEGILSGRHHRLITSVTVGAYASHLTQLMQSGNYVGARKAIDHMAASGFYNSGLRDLSKNEIKRMLHRRHILAADLASALAEPVHDFVCHYLIEDPIGQRVVCAVSVIALGEILSALMSWHDGNLDAWFGRWDGDYIGGIGLRIATNLFTSMSTELLRSMVDLSPNAIKVIQPALDCLQDVDWFRFAQTTHGVAKVLRYAYGIEINREKDLLSLQDSVLALIPLLLDGLVDGLFELHYFMQPLPSSEFTYILQDASKVILGVLMLGICARIPGGEFLVSPFQWYIMTRAGKAAYHHGAGKYQKRRLMTYIKDIQRARRYEKHDRLNDLTKSLQGYLHEIKKGRFTKGDSPLLMSCHLLLLHHTIEGFIKKKSWEKVMQHTTYSFVDGCFEQSGVPVKEALQILYMRLQIRLDRLSSEIEVVEVLRCFKEILFLCRLIDGDLYRYPDRLWRGRLGNNRNGLYRHSDGQEVRPHELDACLDKLEGGISAGGVVLAVVVIVPAAVLTMSFLMIKDDLTGARKRCDDLLKLRESVRELAYYFLERVQIYSASALNERCYDDFRVCMLCLRVWLKHDAFPAKLNRDEPTLDWLPQNWLDKLIDDLSGRDASSSGWNRDDPSLGWLPQNWLQQLFDGLFDRYAFSECMPLDYDGWQSTTHPMLMLKYATVTLGALYKSQLNEPKEGLFLLDQIPIPDRLWTTWHCAFAVLSEISSGSAESYVRHLMCMAMLNVCCQQMIDLLSVDIDDCQEKILGFEKDPKAGPGQSAGSENERVRGLFATLSDNKARVCRCKESFKHYPVINDPDVPETLLVEPSWLAIVEMPDESLLQRFSFLRRLPSNRFDFSRQDGFVPNA